MDGARVRQFMENEVEAMLKTYEQFQILIPAEGKKRSSSSRRGWDICGSAAERLY